MLNRIIFFLISLPIGFFAINAAFAETGEITYSGKWGGALSMRGFSTEYSGTWQFQVDFDAGEVEGWFKGDGSGDITGTVSDDIIEAAGEAAFGVVQWSGEFSSDREEISGTWEITEMTSEFGKGSGTWSGSLDESEKESPGEQETEGIPRKDQALVEEEALERHPGRWLSR